MTSPISEAQYQQYLDALLRGESAHCKDIVVSLLAAQLNLIDLYEFLFRRSLYDIGELWAKNLISVADEHIATAITENLLSLIRPVSADFESTQKKVLVSCLSSDLHQIGAKMVSNLFESHGWESFFLGANMPVSDLMEAIQRIQPDVVCLSLALVEHLRTLEVVIKEIRSFHLYLPIVVGGRAFVNQEQESLRLEQFQHVYLIHSMDQLKRFITNFA